MDTIDATLARIARMQAGAFHARQALDAGVASHALATRVKRRSIFRIHPRTYVVGHDNTGPETQRWGAVLATGPESFLTGMAAAVARRVTPVATAVPEVLVRRRHRPVAGVVLHESRTLADEDVTLLHGLPIVSVERMILDLAVTMPPGQLRRYVRECDFRRMLDMERMHRVLARNAQHWGWSTARQAVHAYLHGDGGSDSKLEERFMRMLRASGVTDVVQNVEFTFGHCVVRPDVWLSSASIAIEIDSANLHDLPDVTREDRLRQSLLATLGIRTIRVSEDQLERGVQDVLAALADPSNRPFPGAPPHVIVRMTR